VIGGVKLTPEQYDRYEATAGPLVQRAMTSLVTHPGWQNISLADRVDTLRATISAMRQQAATAMQISDPKLVQQGLQQQRDYISGKTNTPRPKRAPELATP
jgi:G:T/U-mismatch repair DNA glycosylase